MLKHAQYLTLNGNSSIAVIFVLLFSCFSATAQTELWHATDTVNNFFSTNVLLVDANNNIYISGRGFNSGNYTSVIVKRESNGTLAWNYKCDLFSNDFYDDKTIIDSAGNLYIVGSAINSTYNGAVIKIDASGNNLWHQELDPLGGYDRFTNAAIDVSGNLYAVGRSNNPINNDNRVWITKFNSNGTVLWSQFYTSADSSAYANNVKIDGNGDIIVSGELRKANGQYAMLVLKYNSVGTLLWTQTSNHTVPYHYREGKIEVDENNNLYYFANVDSFNSGSFTSKDEGIVAIKINPSGNIQWVKYLFNSTHNIGRIYSPHIYDNNVIYFGGIGDSSSLRQGYYAAMNTNNGDIIWRKIFRGDSGNGGAVYDLKISANNIYVTGLYGGLGTSDDYYTSKINKTNGEVLWSATYNGFSNGQDYARYLALDNAENIIVTGFAREYSPISNSITTIKYGNLTNIKEHNEGKTSVSVYPHPFQSSVTFNIHVPGESSGSFQLIDINGKIVAQSNNISFSKGDNLINLNLSELNSGIYFSNIQTQFGTIRKKIICVK